MKTILNGINMAFEDSGAGPAVCLVHGFPLDRRMWRPQVAALVSAGYRVITPDLRGFGESDAPQGAYSMAQFSDDLSALFDHLGIERAVVGGMSMGGYVLLNFLERYPGRLAAACFIVTRGGADDGAAKERRLGLAREAMDSGTKIIADSFGKVLFAPRTASEQPGLVAEVHDWMEGNKPAGLAGGLLAMAGRKDYTPLLGSFGLPALVIGADQDQAAPLEIARALAAGLPQGKLCIISEAGHLANLEQPKAFNECLLEFLKGLPPW